MTAALHCILPYLPGHSRDPSPPAAGPASPKRLRVRSQPTCRRSGDPFQVLHTAQVGSHVSVDSWGNHRPPAHTQAPPLRAARWSGEAPLWYSGRVSTAFGWHLFASSNSPPTGTCIIAAGIWTTCCSSDRQATWRQLHCIAAVRRGACCNSLLPGCQYMQKPSPPADILSDLSGAAGCCLTIWQYRGGKANPTCTH